MPRSAATDRYLRWISNMLKSPSNRSAPCSWRQARAILASLASSATSAFSSVRPSRNRRTRTWTEGWYSITGAPTPAAAARTELRYSWSLSIASSSLPPEATLATNDPLPLVILKFRLVSPPGSSVTVRGRLATLGTWSKMASSSESTSVTLAPGVGDVARASGRITHVARAKFGRHLGRFQAKTSRWISWNFSGTSPCATSRRQRVWTVSPAGHTLTPQHRGPFCLEDQPMSAATEQAGGERDSADLARFGYRQELRRSLGTFSSFAVAFSYISPSTGIFTLFALGLTTLGGAFIWTWPVVALGQFIIALNFAEVSSHYPIAGSVFQWTKYLSRRGYAWFSGWIYLFAGVLTVTAVVATIPLALIPALNGLGWHGLGLTLHTELVVALITLVVITVLNIYGVRLVAIINNTGVLFEILGMFVFALILMAFHNHQGFNVVTKTDGLHISFLSGG